MANKEPEVRVLAFRVESTAFDALTAACAAEGMTKTEMVLEGLELALKKHGQARAAKRFSSRPPPMIRSKA